MPILKHKGNEIQVKKNEEIKEAAEELGVPFRCKSGSCGSCIVEILEGQENLSELTHPEKNLAMDKGNRLACQCKIQKGVVEIDF